MTDPGITLNIYNKPSRFEENQDDNINQTETNLNVNNEFADNLRTDSTPAPRANNLQTIDNTRNESVKTIDNNQSSLPPIPQQNQGPPTPMYVQGQPVQPMMIIQNLPTVMTTCKNSYNQYNPYQQQVIVIQQDPNQQQRNKANDDQTITVQDQTKNDDPKDCCKAFFAGCCLMLAACGLLCLCFGGERGRRGRQRW